MNTLTAIGRLSADSQTRFFESGSILSEFSLVVNRVPYRNDQGKKITPPPTYLTCKYWHRSGELPEYLIKGKQIGITAQLETESWKDRQTGENRYKLVARVNQLDLLADPRESAQPEESTHQSAESSSVQGVTEIEVEPIPY
ncbi:single-stranded DNA-binding protein (plasmid) [Kovacikia minuta CCNUW1]|uniref:single-stranded DNA-binding protein n=1 Tax=Kovacikia minuta TaxID=2931930 RepID=UPI001CCE5876|nr:single-stranded DNA-binding protein [Kovacikia minuta]UBF29881.1 single-stranded DNA-binding protein [Kovacikia minuta CCNUW1]